MAGQASTGKDRARPARDTLPQTGGGGPETPNSEPAAYVEHLVEHLVARSRFGVVLENVGLVAIYVNFEFGPRFGQRFVRRFGPRFGPA